jgi:hypothetical protein
MFNRDRAAGNCVRDGNRMAEKAKPLRSREPGAEGGRPELISVRPATFDCCDYYCFVLMLKAVMNSPVARSAP